MAILLTADQVTQLQGAVNAANAAMARDATQSGLWVNAYNLLASDLTTVDGAGNAVPIDGVDPAVWLWISGASAPNGDNGAFGDLIRAYTATQYQLRNGTALTPDDLNWNSNLIGQNFFADLFLNHLDNGSLVSLPKLADDIAPIDAGRWNIPFLCFSDSVGNVIFDGQVLRIKFAVTRLDEMKPNAPLTGRRYPACRVVLSASGALDLISRVQQITTALRQAAAARQPPQQSSDA